MRGQPTSGYRGGVWISTAILLALVGGLLAPAEAAVFVWPGEIHLASPPHREAQAHVHLQNRTPHPQLIHLYLTYWEPGSEESESMSSEAPSTGARSLAPFLTGGLPPLVELGPHERATLTVSFRRPEGDPGTRWVGIAFLTPPPAPRGPGESPPTPEPARTEPEQAPRLLRRQVVRIYHTPLPLEPAQGQVDSIRPHPTHPHRWLVDFTNESDRVLRPRLAWRLTDTTGRRVATGSIPGVTLYPGRHPISFGPLPDLDPGVYQLLVVLQWEEEPAVAGELLLHVEKGAASPEGVAVP